MKVELFYAPGCSQCEGPRHALKTAALARHPEIDWADVNVLDAIDRAVDCGVLSLPALAIDGQLVFPKLPSVEALCQALEGRSKAEA